MNSRKCDICKVDVHRASYVKHLGSKKQIENIKRNEMIIPEWLFQEPSENEIKNIYNPKQLKQLAREIIKLADKQLNKELARKMIKPYYFTDRALRVGSKNKSDSQHINHANSKLTIIPKYCEFAIEVRYINKIMKKLSLIYAGLVNQYIFKYQTVFLARFDKQDENNQILDEQNYLLI